MNKIAYCITVCQERQEIQKLIEQIQKYIRPIDEIVTLFDEKNGSNEVREYLETVENITLVRADFDNDFASFKNRLFEYATGTHLLFLDADEVPHHLLLSYLPDIIDGNPDVDLFWIPRINTVEGITDAYVKERGWNINEDGWINWPDSQGRLVKNDFPRLKWSGSVHETIQGAEIYSALPQEEYLSLYHPKSFQKQQQQNALYDKI